MAKITKNQIKQLKTMQCHSRDRETFVLDEVDTDCMNQADLKELLDSLAEFDMDIWPFKCDRIDIAYFHLDEVDDVPGFRG